MKVDRFAYQSLQEMLDEAKKLGYDFPVDYNPESVLQRPLEFYHNKIDSRILAQPVEGFDAQADGAPGQRTIDRYVELARRGFRLIWLESVSVSEQGRSNPAQLWITEQNVDDFRKLTERIRREAGHSVSIIIQLTHSGRYSNPAGISTPVCAFSNPYIPKEKEHILSDEEVRNIEDDYVRAAYLAEQAGFDVLDIRACHGYLINEFFAAYNRKGMYGGSFENRIRFLLNVLDKVKETVNDIGIAVRLNMYDGIPWPYGWGVDPEKPELQSLEEPLKLVKILYDREIRILNITNGVGAFSPFVIRPYDSGGKEPFESQFAGIDRMLRCAAEVKKVAPEAVVIASAFSWLREYGPYVAAGGIERGWFDVAGFGRQTIAYPEMIEDIMENAGMKREKCCRTCCGCTRLIKEKGENVRCIFRKDK